MTFKAILLVYRKPSVSLAEFKRLYEASHVPLVKELTGDLFPLSHKRYYISDVDRPAATQFDAITEMTFADHAAFQGFYAKLMKGDNGTKVAADCDAFLDGARTTMVVVDDVKETRDADSLE